MAQLESRKSYVFNRPGKYRICVHGFLDTSWSERLAGLRITTSSSKDKGPIAVLVGQLRDQAELAGVLNTLYEMHLTLRSVEYLSGD
jgi:hypothetical protein